MTHLQCDAPKCIYLERSHRIPLLSLSLCLLLFAASRRWRQDAASVGHRLPRLPADPSRTTSRRSDAATDRLSPLRDLALSSSPVRPTSSSRRTPRSTRPMKAPTASSAAASTRPRWSARSFSGVQLRRDPRTATDFIFDFESAGGRGISARRSASPASPTSTSSAIPTSGPKPYLARVQLHQTIGFTDKLVDSRRGRPSRSPRRFPSAASSSTSARWACPTSSTSTASAPTATCSS